MSQFQKIRHFFSRTIEQENLSFDWMKEDEKNRKKYERNFMLFNNEGI